MQYNQKTETNNAKKYLRNARKAILGRGGEISPTAGLKDLPEAIYKIPADASLAFRSDDTVAYRKIVPSGAEEFAQVAKVGGMTHKSKNRFRITRIDDDDNFVSKQTDSSIELIIPAGTSDGYVDVNMDLSLLGTTPHVFTVYGLPDDIECYIWYDFYDEEGDWTSDDKVYPGGTFNPNDVYSQAFVEITGITASEDRFLTLQFMLNKDSNASYTPYFEGLRDTKVTELVSEGANIFDISTATFKNQGSASNVSSEIVDEVLKITTRIDCAAGSYYYAYYNKPIPLNGKSKVYVSADCKPVGHERSLFRLDVYEANTRAFQLKEVWFETDGRYSSGEIAIPEAYRSDKYDLRVTFYSVAGRACSAGAYCEYSNIMISFGTDEYKPYRAEAVDTFTISADLRAFLEQYGYGRGVEGYPNYIDFERKVFVQNTYRKVFDGMEKWEISAAVPPGQTDTGLKRMHLNIKDMPAKQIDNWTVAPMICNLYNTGTMENTYYCINNTCSCSNKSLYIYDANYNSAESLESWKSHLEGLHRNGNPLIVEYALAEPIEVAISAYLKDDIVFLQVEGGGTITAVNEREQAVPSTINYIAKVGG